MNTHYRSLDREQKKRDDEGADFLLLLDSSINDWYLQNNLFSFKDHLTGL